MRRTFRRTAAIPLLVAASVLAGGSRVKLVPTLQPAQILTYLIRYQSDKNVKTEGTVVAPTAPNAAQVDAHALLQIEVLDVHPAANTLTLHARARFLTLDFGVWLKKNGDKEPHWNIQRIDPDGKTIEFTISSDGSVEKLQGVGSLLPDQQQAWQEWVARFVLAWTFPSPGVKLGEKWKSEQVEQAAAPIAGLNWERESTYVRNERCHATQLSVTGEVSPSMAPAETCAVVLTTATLKQKSSPKDATPEDFKLHDLRTVGTAKGTNEIITYISLRTGLVIRATEAASQFMDVVVAMADGSNRVHYNVDATSHSELLLVTDSLLAHP
jgi:hypothetical protein